jgi:LDH2 family malate/lactate/ureidoglycolate dehydrogenase
MNDAATIEAEARVPAARLSAFISRALVAAGLPTADAEIAAGLMTEADLRGSDTHGVIRLPLYVRRIRAGGIKANPDIRVISDRPSAALIDGDNAMGHLVMRRATHLAIDKAKATGVGWVGARMSNHAGPAALYATLPLHHDMIGIYFAMGSNNHLPPWGGSECLLGTSPMAVAVPAGEEPPIVLDMAPTVAAFGKVRLKAQRGEQMPVGWMIDRDGKPLTDPKRAEEGYLLPIGDYKGAGLSLIIGLLAGALNRAAMGRDVVDFVKEVGTPTNTGHAICALAIDTFVPPADFKRTVDSFIRDIRNSRRLPGVERIWLPGEQTHTKLLERRAHGVPIPKALRDSLNAVARDLNIAPLG